MLRRVLYHSLHLVADFFSWLASVFIFFRDLWMKRNSPECYSGNLSAWISEFKLSKLPKHIGIIIAEDPISYSDISRLALWCMAMGITYISIYDHDGAVKKNKQLVYDRLTELAQKLLVTTEKKYKIKLDTLGVNGTVNGYNSAEVVIKTLSYMDGRPQLAEVAKEISTSVSQGSFKPLDITTELLDERLTLKKTPDPDLLVRFGNVECTVGFLPWHIRLSEIMSLPSHHQVKLEDFCKVLQRFSSCEQRFGK